ncbi:hypothetical protein [Saccharothrix sp. NRRL B-16348]|uniref:hypothetical protein n=1 Tax=Saccharothrix sp. NRRL B-16348 TaxID=1415542 RepID=UPI000AC5F70A|nr:hypothetical protein [Saccharothrix sp. NRRL B-16348]
MVVAATALMVATGTVGTAVAASGTFYVNGEAVLVNPSNDNCHALALERGDYAKNDTDAEAYHYYDVKCTRFAFSAGAGSEGTIDRTLRGPSSEPDPHHRSTGAPATGGAAAPGLAACPRSARAAGTLHA